MILYLYLVIRIIVLKNYDCFYLIQPVPTTPDFQRNYHVISNTLVEAAQSEEDIQRYV